jgi:hypothetical protein
MNIQKYIRGEKRTFNDKDRYGLRFSLNHTAEVISPGKDKKENFLDFMDIFRNKEE